MHLHRLKRAAGRVSVAVCLLAAGLTSAQATSATPDLPVVSYTLSVDGPHNGYGYNDNGGDLTDGVFGMTVGGGYYNWAPYVLWDNVSPTITFDLGQVRAVGGITGYFLAYPSAAVTLPPEAIVSFSNDGVAFGAPVALDLSPQFPGGLGNDQPVVLSLLAAPGQGRFVALTLQTPGRWIALSEVTFQAAAVPEPQAWSLLMAGLGVVLMVRRQGLRRSSP